MGLKPTRPGVAQSTRSTQRIVLPTPPGSKPNSTKPLSMAASTGRINLPIGMILRCLPPEVLAEELSKFEANGTAATEIGLPMNMILGQLPSGKVEMTLQDLVPHFPPGYLQPTESITNYLPQVINLPLMDVVMRIPPDLLALRPDQKDVDAAVINMADPFTEEILREQAESARKQTATNIIEESQAPQEEFVPRDSIVPPRRPAAEPLSGLRTAPTTLAGAPPPMPQVAKVATPAASVNSLRGSGTVPPSIPGPSGRGASASQQISIPSPSTTTLPSLPIRGPGPTDTAALGAAPVPPVPRHTGPIPAPPPPRHTTTLPVPRRTGALPTISAPTPAVSGSAGPAPAAPVEEPVSVEQVAAAVEAGAPDPAADDLKRLAALAMAEMDDGTDSGTTKADSIRTSEPIRAPAPEAPAPSPVATAPVAAPLPKPVSILRPQAPAPQPVSPETPEQTGSPAPAASVAFNLNTCTAEDLVQNIRDCSPVLAAAIIEHRTKLGSYRRLEDLLDVPGMTKTAYTNLTGEPPPPNRIPLSLNELLGFPPEQSISLKDVTDRIACWPDVTGCVLSQSSGLSLVGTVPEGVDKSAIVAFAPRMFEAINKSFAEVSGQETDALVIPSAGTSFHLFRNRDLYLIIMSRLPQMPERHVKVARFVLAALGIRRD
jgi:DNA uptake protein ComE-like DNA-binding protein